MFKVSSTYVRFSKFLISYYFPMRFLLLIILGFCLSFGETLYIAVASSMRPPLEEIVSRFKVLYPEIKVKVSYGSSGNFYRQIIGGAPYHIFISASKEYVRRLEIKKKVKKENVKPIVKGVLVLYTVKENIDLSEGLEVLKKVKRIAIASPKHAPYGIAAMEVLKNSGLYKEVRYKLVYGTNVGHAFQYVYTKSVDVGFVSLSLVKISDKGRYFIIPQELYTPLIHTAVLLKETEGSRKFFEFLTSGSSIKIFKKYGFEELKDDRSTPYKH